MKQVVKEGTDQIIGNVILKNAEIIFKGTNNVFFCKNKLILENCKVRFTGNHSLIYIDENDYPMSLNMRVGNDSVIYIGKDCYVNRTSHLYATERKNIIIGNQLLLSFETYFRTADPHIIYDCNLSKRVNESKSILIGDRVWIGQESLLLKGTVIGSGGILGGHTVIANKRVPSNTLFAGNPACKMKEHVFFGYHYSTHDFTEEQEQQSLLYQEEAKKQFVYEKDKYTCSLEQIDQHLQHLSCVQDKINYIEKNIVKNKHKNRFYLS